MDIRTISEVGIGIAAASAVIFAFLLFLRFLLDRASKSLDTLENTTRRLEDTMAKIEIAMVNRDQIVLNHLEHFMEAMASISQVQEQQSRLLQKICREWGINGGEKR